jgi:hypothetical protein
MGPYDLNEFIKKYNLHHQPEGRQGLKASGL